MESLNFLAITEKWIQLQKTNPTWYETEDIGEANQHLRVLRSECAVNSDFPEIMISHDSFQHLLGWLMLFSEMTEIPEKLKLHLHIMVQVFANLITSSPKAQTLIWPQIWPSIFRLLRHDDRKLGMLVTAFLYNCTINSPQHFQQMAKSPDLLSLLLKGSEIDFEPAQDEFFDWITNLFEKLLTEGFFSQTWNLLSQHNKELLKRDTHLKVVREQVILLKFLDAFCARNDISAFATIPSLTFLIQLFVNNDVTLFSSSSSHQSFPNTKNLNNLNENNNQNNNNQNNNNQNNNNQNNIAQNDGPSSTEKSEEILSSNSVESLHLQLQILGNITASDLYHKSPALKQCFQDSSFLDHVIRILITAVEEEKKINLLKGKQKGKLIEEDQFVFGFKKELVRLLANLSFHNPFFQEKIRELNGIPAILNCANYDSKNPYIREWSIVCVRNLLQDNKKNQNLIEELKAQRISQSGAEELEKKGLKMWFENGKAVVKSVNDDM